jgi:hypothetical protein
MRNFVRGLLLPGGGTEAPKVLTTQAKTTPPSNHSSSTQGFRDSRGQVKSGKWLSLAGICFDDFDERQGRAEPKGIVKGRQAVQARKDGNGVVAFRSSPELSLDAVTVIRLSAAGRLGNRLSVGVVSEQFKPSEVAKRATQNTIDADLVCNGVTGIGAILSVEDFASEANKTERISLFVQIDLLERELLVFRMPAVKSTASNNVQQDRCYSPSQDVLVAALKIPSHWQTCYFAVDLCGYGDGVLIDDASRWVSNKKRRSTRTLGSIPSRFPTTLRQSIETLPAKQRTKLERLLNADQDDNANKPHSCGGGTLTAENPLGPQGETHKAEPWADGILPLLSQSTLRDFARIKNNDTVVDLNTAVKLQTWLYRRAIALKPIVICEGVQAMREPMVAPLCLQSLQPSDRGVSLRLVRDAHRQCGHVGVLPTITVREMAPQLIAWSREYGCSAAELLSSKDEYMSERSGLSQNVTLPTHRTSTRISEAEGADSGIHTRKDSDRQRYVCEEVKPAMHYICYSWDMRWSVLVDDSIPRALVGFDEANTMWIDIFSFNYAGRLGPGQLSPLPGIQRTIQKIGSTVVLVGERATTLRRLWCLVEILMTAREAEADLVMCFLESASTAGAAGAASAAGVTGVATGASNASPSTSKVGLIGAILAAAGRFDTMIDVATAQCAGSKQEHRVLRGWLHRNFKSNKGANECARAAVRQASRDVLATDKRAGFSVAEIDDLVAFAQELGPHLFVDATSGKRNHALWEKLENYAFPSS